MNSAIRPLTSLVALCLLLLQAVPLWAQPAVLNEAVVLWQADTNVVSAFLQSAPYLSPAEVASQGMNAYLTALQEPVHKGVLDAQFLNGPTPSASVAAASKVLIQGGAFPIVLSSLLQFAVNGATMNSTQVLSLVQSTNVDRCGSVLPEIDTYFAVTANYVGTAPLTATRPSNCNVTVAAQTSAGALAQAVILWKADTDVVSGFIQSAPYLSPEDLAGQGLNAYLTALQEPVHKGVLDDQFNATAASPSLSIAAASQVLIQDGAFPLVLSALLQFATNGSTMTPAEVLSLVQSFNANRCTYVLPAIDTYFAVTAVSLGTAPLTATRPSNCNVPVQTFGGGTASSSSSSGGSSSSSGGPPSNSGGGGSSSGGPLSGGAIAGLVIGIAVGVAVLAVAFTRQFCLIVIVDEADPSADGSTSAKLPPAGRSGKLIQTVVRSAPAKAATVTSTPASQSAVVMTTLPPVVAQPARPQYQQSAPAIAPQASAYNPPYSGGGYTVARAPDDMDPYASAANAPSAGGTYDPYADRV